jgi:hypothetical protein
MRKVSETDRIKSGVDRYSSQAIAMRERAEPGKRSAQAVRPKASGIKAARP